MLKTKKHTLLSNAPEVIIFSFLIILIGYFIDKGDPLLMHYPFNSIMLCLAMVTLYYGIYMGLVMWGVFAIFLFMTDKDDPILKFFLLEKLFFVILFGLFYYNYKKSLRYLKLHNNYLKVRLKEFNNSFFTLKISHDKLESTYISQPTSLHYVLSDLLDRADHNTLEESAENLLKVLEKNFMVKKSMLWQVEQGELVHLIAYRGEVSKIVDRKDILLEEALLYKKAIYLKNLEDKEQTKYIFVIPYMNAEEDVISLLIIEEIPFLFYREDIIVKINVIFHYIWMESEKRALVEEVYEKENRKIEGESQDIIDFKSEVIRLQRIKNEFGIESRIYALKTESAYFHESISDYFYKNNNLKVLNQYISIQCQNNYLHFIIFPFTLASTMPMSTKEFDEMIESLQCSLENHIGKKIYGSIQSKSVGIDHINNVWEEYGCVER